MRREPGVSLDFTIGPGNNRFEWKERVETVAANRSYGQCGITLNNATYSEPYAGLIADFNTKSANLLAACVEYFVGVNTALVPNTTLTLSWDNTNKRFVLTRGGGARRIQLLFGNLNSVAPSLGFGTVSLPTGFAGPGPANTNITAATFADANWYNTGTTNGAVVGTASVAARGYQAWQTITSNFNLLYYSENNGASSCIATIPPGFYVRGQALGNVIAAQMNACVRPAGANVYQVVYDPVTGRFTFRTVAPNNTRNFTLRWQSGTPANIGGALAAYTGTAAPGGTLDRGEIETPVYTDIAVAAGGSWQTPRDSIRLLRRGTGDENQGVDFDPDGLGPLATRDRTSYITTAGSFFNGELFYVHGDGSLCGVDLASPVKTDPPSVRLQQISNCNNLGSTVGTPVAFEFGGGLYGGNNISCNGFQTNVKLTSCDAASNISLILPNLEKEFPVEHNTALPAFGTLKTYQERLDGTRGMSMVPALGGVKSDGSTPIANSLIGIRAVFGTSTATGLWGLGQADDPVTTTINETRGPIRQQATPREPTIVMFVTDGDDTCPSGGSGNDDNALRAASKAEDLYRLIEADKPESSVTTYVIGFGTGASTNRLNWIAWGGSGLGQGLTGQPQVSTTNGTGAGQRWDGSVETPAILQNKRAQCTTCVDAFIAPDADTLAKQLQSILDRGAGSGEFTAQASVFTSVTELVKELDTPTTPRDPDGPNTRYLALVPNLFRSTFQMPGFKGQLRAFQNTGGEVSQKWNAGQKLYDRVTTAMASCLEAGGGARGRVPLRHAPHPDQPAHLLDLAQRGLWRHRQRPDQRRLAHQQRQPHAPVAPDHGRRPHLGRRARHPRRRPGLAPRRQRHGLRRPPEGVRGLSWRQPLGLVCGGPAPEDAAGPARSPRDDPGLHGRRAGHPRREPRPQADHGHRPAVRRARVDVGRLHPGHPRRHRAAHPARSRRLGLRSGVRPVPRRLPRLQQPGEQQRWRRHPHRLRPAQPRPGRRSHHEPARYRPPESQARDDRGVRRRQRHAACVPRRTQLQRPRDLRSAGRPAGHDPGLLRVPVQRLQRAGRRGAVGLRALRPARQAPRAHAGPDPHQPHLHAGRGAPLRRRVRAEPRHGREPQRDQPDRQRRAQRKRRREGGLAASAGVRPRHRRQIPDDTRRHLRGELQDPVHRQRASRGALEPRQPRHRGRDHRRHRRQQRGGQDVLRPHGRDLVGADHRLRGPRVQHDFPQELPE